jgi:hypothetical protein
MRKQHVAVLTTIALVVLCSVHTARDARADTAGGALIDATGASTQSQVRMRYITAGDNHTCIVLSNNSVKCFGMGADGQLGNGTVDNIGDSTASSVATSSAVSIGTGRTATPDDAAEAHRTVRQTLADLYSARFAERTRVIYGGSVNAKNAADLFSHEEIDGGLVGGASLNATDFATIIAAAAARCQA